MARIERRHLEAFTATAESGSFVAAAHRLRISPSSVSKAISALEAVTGRRLFHRTPAGATLTEPAAKLVNPAQRALALMTALEDPAHGGDDLVEDADSLHIVAAVSLTPDPLARIVGEYLRRYRGRRLTVEGLRIPELDSAVELVARGHYDAGLTETPRTVPPDLTVVPLRDTTFYAALPPGTSTAMPGEVTTDELLGAGLVVGPHWESSVMHRELVGAEPRLRGAIVTRTAHRGHFLDLVRAGLGAAMLRGDLAIEAVQAGCTVGAVSALSPSRLSVLFRTDAASPSLQQFVRVCRDYVPPQLSPSDLRTGPAGAPTSGRRRSGGPGTTARSRGR